MGTSTENPVLKALSQLLGAVTQEHTSISEAAEEVEQMVREKLRNLCNNLDIYTEVCDELGETCDIKVRCNNTDYYITTRLYVKMEIHSIQQA